MNALVTAYDIITPYGSGVERCWEGLLTGTSALSPVKRFENTTFHRQLAGTIPGLTYHEGDSLVLQSLQRLASRAEGSIPTDAKLLLATTTGEVDLLEQAVLHGKGDVQASGLDQLLRKTQDLFGLEDAGTVVSSACISATAAIAMGASAIRDGWCDCILVVACDAVTEFVFSGFSSLQALDPEGARPFDANRRGLSLGEGAGWLLLMSETRAKREQSVWLGSVTGWGLSNDANHMTGPSRDGEGLARAIRAALFSGGCETDDIDFICAHGTGTVYNDGMELKAFESVFQSPRPVFAVKGGIGHTMGAAGIIEAVLTCKAMQENVLPPTVRMQQPDALAAGWVTNAPLPLIADMAISTNAGFGGVNAALLLRGAEGGLA